MDEWVKDRFNLAKGRMKEITRENDVREPFGDYFRRTAAFLSKSGDIYEDKLDQAPIEKLMRCNRELYEDILPANYGHCYGNPVYASEQLGEYGPPLAFLHAELRGAAVFAFEKRMWDLTILMELFLQVHASFTGEEFPTVDEVTDILKSYVNDYCKDMVLERIEEQVSPDRNFALHLIMSSNLADLRYLYLYGEYVSPVELDTARYLNSLPREQIEEMARTFTEAYRMGFVNAGKDLSKKKTVNIRYRLGFERVVKAAIGQFRQMGLQPVLCRYAVHVVNKRGQHRIGYSGAIANPQYDYDHRQDSALFLDADFVQKKLRATQEAYEEFQEEAELMAGPACIETFGEKLFEPVNNPQALTLTKEQEMLQVEMENESSQISNRYIHRDEASFTIIAYPVPEIGEKFPEIFQETVRINTLDTKLYQRIQQTMIDAANSGEFAEVKGADGNETDLRIHLHALNDPDKEAIFENCGADVNIPVGEIFTTPVLSGTNGLLHVKKVYLEGLMFRDLRLTFQDGMVVDYSCANFDSPEENRKFIEDNILHHHEKLPIGEFAIGTNTTAYVTAQKYGIADKFPILIAEKMGPHFAVGDTCYCWTEDCPEYNPDGKECVARDNEISILRKTDPGKAYFGCHTDITIPYEELDSIRVVDHEGNGVYLIKNGRFALPGTEELNIPLDQA